METLLYILMQLWLVLAQMAPYLLLGFFVAGLLSVLISPALVERHLGGHGFWPILKAAVLGVPLPLCSCGVIPVSASLRRHGASRASTVSFLISTPETGVDSIMVTYSLLGGVFAVVRVVVAFVSGIVGGVLVALLGGREKEPVAAPAMAGTEADHAHEPEQSEACVGGCCATAKPHESLTAKFVRMLRYGFVDLPQDIGKSLLIGLGVAGLIGIIPQEWFQTYLGFLWNNQPGQMLLMMMIGIPMYVCATASVPMAMAFMLKGLSPGAAMIFLMVGPATNAATVAMIWQVMGRRTALIYLCSVAMVALAAGIMMNTFFPDAASGHFAKHHMHDHAEAIEPWQHVAAAVMLALLVVATVRRYWPTRHAHVAVPQDMLTNGQAPTQSAALLHGEAATAFGAKGITMITLKVSGMTCSHCSATVKRTLLETPGVQSAEVDLKAGLANVRGEHLDRDALVQRIKEVGYDAE